VGQCNGVAYPQVADGGDGIQILKGNGECIEQAIADNQQGMILQHGVWSMVKQLTVKP
jgi:hypothetical protein